MTFPSQATSRQGRGGMRTALFTWLLVLVGLALIGVLVGGGWLYRNQESRTRGQVAADLRAVARLKADQIAQWRRERIGNGALLAADRGFFRIVADWLVGKSRGPAAEAEEQIRARFRALQAHYGYEEILLADAEGVIRLSLSGRTGELSDAAATSALRAWTLHEPVLTDLHAHAGETVPAMEVVIPVFAASEASSDPIGAFLLRSSAEGFLYGVTQSWPTATETAETMLVRRDDDDVLFLNPLRRRPDAAMGLRVPLTQIEVPAVQAVVGHEGVVLGRDPTGVSVIAAVLPIQDSPWSLVAEIDADEALAEWRLRSRLILAVVVVLVLGLGVAIVIVLRQRTEYDALSRSATALSLNEARLCDTLELNERLLGAARLGIIVYRAEGPGVLANEGAAQIVGGTAEQLRAMNFREIPSWRKSGLLDAALATLATGEPVNLETRLFTTFGRDIHVQCTVARFESGGRAHLLLTLIDFTERERAEVLRNQLSAIVESTPDFVAMASPAGRIVYFNRAARHLFGLREDQDPATQTIERSHPPWAARLVLEEGMPTAEAKGIWQGETALVTPDGREIPHLQVIMAHKAPDGTVELFSTVARDISERKKIEVELQARMRLLEAIPASTFDQFLQLTLDEIEARTGSSVAFYHVVDADQETLTLQAWSTKTVTCVNVAESKGARRPVSRAGVLGDAVRGRRAITQNERSALNADTGLSGGMAPVVRELVVPILRGERIVAVVGVGNKATPYDDGDVEIVRLLGDFSWEIAERKRAEEELRRAQERLIEANRLRKAVLDGTSFGIVSTDATGVVTTFSAGAARMLGYEAEEIIGRQTPAVFHEEEQLRERAIELTARFGRPVAPDFQACVETVPDGAGEEREWSLQRRDGTTFPAIESISAMRADGGAITGYVCILQDVTERRRVDRALRATEERLEYVLRQADCLVWEARVHLTPNDWEWEFKVHPSGLYNRLFGPDSPEQKVGLWAGFEIPEREQMNRRSREAIEGGATGYVQEFQLIRDGTSMWVRESVSIVPVDGSRFWLVGVITDVTGLKQTEDALTRSLSLVNATLDATVDGILVVDLQGRIVSYNRRFVDLWGLPPGLVEAHDDAPVLQYVVAKTSDPAGFLARVQAIYAEVESDSFDVVELADGRIFERSSRPQRLGDQPVGRVWSFRDVTPQHRAEAELKKLLAELERSNQELEQFAYIASHDLQEPLRMVASYTQLLAQRYGDKLDADAHDFIGFAVDGATRMQRLINDLLAYSRVGMRGKAPTAVSIRSVFDTAVRNLGLAIEDARAVVTAGELPEVLGDPGQLVQLLQNLIGNAIKFQRAGEQPRVEVSAVREGEQWMFAVRDNGIGIAPEFHERIFAIFQRLHARNEYPGTGIGLAVCRRIVERHGGRIWLESVPGAGTTFFFTLPAKPGDSSRHVS